jgi:hypothetical protein
MSSARKERDEFEAEEEAYLESSEHSEEEEEEDVSDEEKYRAKQAECIRNVANFSKVKSFHLMEKGDFNPEMLELYLSKAAPKLEALFEKIEKLDAKDMKTHGTHFKHMIFTDVKSSSYGAKIIASAFVAKGYHPALHVQGPGFSIYHDEKLMETKGQNFGVLMSKTFFNRPMNTKFRKHQLELYNRRPENVQGDLMRFIILDQGFKEGIDLFDIKYVHLFEPLVVQADEKQAIGRGTRFCGQRGLQFHPRYGWPLYVFRYEVAIGDTLQDRFYHSKQMFDLYLKFSNLDMRKVVFASELEKASIHSAVDMDLTRPIHQFSIELPPPILSGGNARISKSDYQVTPPKKMPLANMHRYIATRFGRFEYPEVKLENHCGTLGGANIVKFTPTQDFVRHYFQSDSAYKGMLLFHGVGTGKTCCAIATATTSFDKEGYTILWVTRHTLKSDIWKNMYGQVCSLTIQEKMKDGSIKNPTKKHVSKNWMDPISYKQFSNMLLKKNKIYDEIVRRNGEEDPLHKTLIIIDEAHKVYSPTVAASEKPNTDILEKMIQNSYEKSGKDSVRLLLMTATPYTEDGMEMIQLLNLLRESKEQLPVEFEEFSKEYLDEYGYFHKAGLHKFQDEISGYISYLNRSQDARNFAHPVLENVAVPLTQHIEVKKEDKKSVDAMAEQLKELREKIKETKAMKRDAARAGKQKAKENKGALKEAMAECKEKAKEDAEKALEKEKSKKESGMEKCKEKPVKERKECKEKVTDTYRTNVEDVKTKKQQKLEDCKHVKLPGESNRMSKEEMKEENLDKKLQEYMEKKQEIQEKIQEKKEYKKKLTDDAKQITQERKSFKPTVDKLKKEIEQERKKIRKIEDKEEKKKAQKKLREGAVHKMKELKKDMLGLRNDAVELRLKKKLALLKEGKGSLGDISQASALEKRCKI